MLNRTFAAVVLSAGGLLATSEQAFAQYGYVQPGYQYSAGRASVRNQVVYARPGFGYLRATQQTTQSYRNIQGGYAPAPYAYAPAQPTYPQPGYDYGNTQYQPAPQYGRDQQTDAAMYQFLQPLYRQYLGREPDMPGVQGWVGVYDQLGRNNDLLRQEFIRAAQAELNNRNGVYQGGGYP